MEEANLLDAVRDQLFEVKDKAPKLNGARAGWVNSAEDGASDAFVRNILLSRYDAGSDRDVLDILKELESFQIRDL